MVPPRAAEIEFKASLHQKCRTFLKLSHQERLISRRGSVWTSADDEKTRLQKVFVQWVCVTTISQQSRGCAEMCCNQKNNLKKCCYVKQAWISATPESNYTPEQTPSILLTAIRGVETATRLFNIWNNIYSLETSHLILQEKLRIHFSCSACRWNKLDPRWFDQHRHPKHLLLTMPSRSSDSELAWRSFQGEKLTKEVVFHKTTEILV